ncbi:MAG: class I SAM-dependent methyltransferase [Acetobacteraceae bacterium]|nr:class I SAM-dependent methyltransferase [Acetobacteraceae bacterium]
MHSVEGGRRAKPQLWDTDWLMLRGMASAIAPLVARHVKPADVVLDFGCGSMPYRALVEKAGGTYLGADLGGDAAVAISPDGHLQVADATIDMVISIQVLEHVRDIDLYFSEIARVLKDGGLLLLSTHGTWLYHPHPEDHRRWTRTGLVHDIETRSFRVDEIVAIVGPLATTTMIRLTGFAFFLRRIPLLGPFLAGTMAVVMNLRGWLEDWITPESIRMNNGCVYVTQCVKRSA